MPYDVPAEEQTSLEMPIAGKEKRKKVQPELWGIPIDPAWVEKLTVGEKVTITLEGKVSEVKLREGEHSKTHEMSLRVDYVGLDETDEIEGTFDPMKPK